MKPRARGSGRAHSGGTLTTPNRKKTPLFPASISAGFLRCASHVCVAYQAASTRGRFPRLAFYKSAVAPFRASLSASLGGAGSDFPQRELLCVIYACCASADRGPGLFVRPEFVAQKREKCQKTNEKARRKKNHSLFTVQTD